MRVIKPAGDERHNYQVSILWHNKKVTCDGATRRAARIREVCPRHRGRFSAARRGGREVFQRHRGRFSAARRGGRQVCPPHRGRFSAARGGGREVCPRHRGRFSAARRGGREVSAKIVRFFRTPLCGPRKLWALVIII